ncbi:hypothetical protein AAG614_12190 [Citromicrobium bathyomarinum]
MIRFVTLFLLLTLAVPTGAQACMSSGPDGYATGMVWQNPPKQIPKGGRLLKVEGQAPLEDSWGFSAQVLEGPEHLKGKRLRFASMIATSCNGWGAATGYLVISGKLKSISYEETARDSYHLEAFDYSESWWNWISRFFGGTTWGHAGEPTQEVAT